MVNFKVKHPHRKCKALFLFSVMGRFTFFLNNSIIILTPNSKALVSDISTVGHCADFPIFVVNDIL